MFVFEYNHTNYAELMEAYARQLEVQVVNNKIIFPRNVAIGFMQLIELQSRLQAIIFDYTFTQDFRGKRKKTNQEFYTLWFNEITVSQEAFIEIENEPNRTRTGNRHARLNSRQRLELGADPEQFFW